jgi:hypothetical protein
MEKQYHVQTYQGDYPVENQTYWNVPFESLEAAIPAALEQQSVFLAASPTEQIYTLISDDEEGMEVAWIVIEGKMFTGPEAQKIADDLIPSYYSIG